MDIHELGDLIKKGYGGRELTSLYTEKIDTVIKEVFSSAFGGGRNSTGLPKLCVIAVGGYGRGELAPFSDVDIMLFAKDRSESESAREFLYRLWNTNLDISHSFRTPSDCIGEAKKDVRTKTSLLEHRYIAGDRDLYGHFNDTVYPEVAFRNQRDFITEKLREVEARKKRFGDSVFMLEPNIKEGRGGLRDLHSIFWLASVAFKAGKFDDLEKILTPYDLHRLGKAYDFLLKVRFCLHLLSGRKNDSLTFEFHDSVAEMLNFKSSRRFFASERFMRYFYLKASIVNDIAAYALDVCSMPYVSLPGQLMKKRITGNFFVAKERIAATRDLSEDTDLIMEAFYVMSRTGKRFSPRLKAEIKKNLFRITKRARRSPKAVAWFMSIIGGDNAYETLWEMHHCGVLGRFIPEFGALTFLVVYEPYHRYTVDEHSLRAVRKLEELGKTRYKSLEHLSAVYRRMKHKEALILSLLLHDIGKRVITRERRFPDPSRDGAGGYHEGEGYMEMKKIMERFNLDIGLRNRMEFLVKNHTLLSSAAFKRETDDPEVIAQCADEVIDRENLDALYLLTYADVASVSPDFWTDWKDYLLRELYETVSRYIEGFAETGRDHIGAMLSLSKGEKEGMKRFLALMPDRYVISSPPEKICADYKLSLEVAEKKFAMRVNEAASGGLAEITVGTWDAPGLLSRIVGVLSSMGMSIYKARVYTGENGLVIDRVWVSNWKDLLWEGLVQKVGENLERSIVLRHPARLETSREKCRATAGGPGFYGRFAPFVELDNETSSDYSVLEFFAQDRLGLLYDATSVMHEMGIDILSARINTESGLAHDIFTIKSGGAKMDGPAVPELLACLWEKLQ